MAKRETCLLGKTYDEKKHSISGWMMSEKLDGLRAIWDGGITRGMWADEVPWANTQKDSYRRRATGLWSRYLKPIQATNEWLNQLPKVPLDGELWSNDGWEKTSSTVRRLDESGDWSKIRYYTFDSPALEILFEDGTINNPQIKKEIRGVEEWLVGKGGYNGEPREFEFSYKWMSGKLEQNEVFRILKQRQLSFSEETAREEMMEELVKVLKKGGEGLVLRSPYSIWKPERSNNVLKVKDCKDDEGIVVGFVGGRGKLAGLFGALILDYKGRRLELSGFSDEERRIVNGEEDILVPENMGGMELGLEYEGKYFRRGDVVSFKYRELSEKSIPKEARFWRKLI